VIAFECGERLAREPDGLVGLVALAENGHRSGVKIHITPTDSLPSVVVRIADYLATPNASVSDSGDDCTVAGFFHRVVAALVDGIVGALFDIAHDDLTLFGRPELLVMFVSFVVVGEGFFGTVLRSRVF